MFDQPQRDALDAVARVLGEARSILFVTGAGISADSGVPTYRGIGGLYDVEHTDEGIPIEEILSGDMFRSAPALTWKYLAQIAAAARGAHFNRAHEVVAEIEQRLPRVWTLTQNVDGFHHLAGSQNVIEIHGNMRSLSCTLCPYHMTVDEDDELAVPPRCPDCRGIMRPDVVLFGESLPETALNELRRELQTGFEAVVCIGTSELFPYIQEPVVLARHRGVPTVEINPAETLLSGVVDYRIAAGAATAMDEIWRRMTSGA
ncbi:MAG: NAD-dependent protein deacylase [Pirellulales bacterium]